MPQLTDYLPLPKQYLKIGKPVPVNVYIFMPINNNLVHFRKQGQALTLEDYETIAKVEDANLLVPKGEYIFLIHKDQNALADHVKAGKPNLEAIQQTAKSIVKGLNEAGTPEALKETLDSSFKMVTDMVSLFKESPSAESFTKVLQKVSASEDPLVTHNRHVSALSVLALVAVGNASMEDLADISFAGLVHDLGFGYIGKIHPEHTELAQKLLLRHLDGDEKFNQAEQAVYDLHMDATIQLLSKARLAIPDGARRIIQQHHESWDGNGPQNLIENKIYRTARVMRIIDDLTTLISHSKMRFKEAYELIANKKNKISGKPIYDPKFVDDLLKIL